MRNFENINWDNAQKISSQTFICWNCGKEIASEQGYTASYKAASGINNTRGMIHICHYCKAPNVQDKLGYMILSPVPGDEIKNLPEDIKCIYNEARACMSVQAYTAAVMLFRKILMNIAVNEGAEEGKDFKFYLGYLCKERLVHPKQTKQAEKVKDLGNEANHKIKCQTKEDAEMLFKFIEHFLKTNYEFADEVEDNDK